MKFQVVSQQKLVQTVNILEIHTTYSVYCLGGLWMARVPQETYSSFLGSSRRASKSEKLAPFKLKNCQI